MRRPPATTIGDLARLGQELADDHLALVVGSRRKETYRLDCSIVNGQQVCQAIPD
jgi:hypothetical protein